MTTDLESLSTMELQKALLAADKRGDRAESARLREFMSIESVTARQADTRTPNQQAIDRQRDNDMAAIASAREGLDRAIYGERNRNYEANVKRCRDIVATCERAVGGAA